MLLRLFSIKSTDVLNFMLLVVVSYFEMFKVPGQCEAKVNCDGTLSVGGLSQTVHGAVREIHVLSTWTSQHLACWDETPENLSKTRTTCGSTVTKSAIGTLDPLLNPTNPKGEVLARLFPAGS